MLTNFDKTQNQMAVPPETGLKQKNIYLIFGIVILLIACAAIAAVCFWPKKFSQKNPLGYYQELGDKCRNNGCCLTSVKTMSDGNFKLEPEAGCPADYKSNMLLCAQSYKWCEPVKNAEATSTEANINIADWQTYRNEEYEIKYPNNWFLAEKQKGNILISSQKLLSGTDAHAGHSLSIMVFDDPLNLTAQEWRNKNKIEKIISIEEKEIEINGGKAIQYTDIIKASQAELDSGYLKDSQYKKIRLYLNSENKIYEITWIETEDAFDNELAIMEAITKSFNLVKDEMVVWQTYRNKELGFSFKYPSDWRFDTNDPDQLRGEKLALNVGFYKKNYKNNGLYETNIGISVVDVNLFQKQASLPDNKNTDFPSKKESVKINDIDAVKSYDVTPAGAMDSYSFKKGDLYYDFGFQSYFPPEEKDEHRKIFEKIVSTFSFE